MPRSGLVVDFWNPAPGVDLRIGLGISRLVFRALNSVEAVLAAVLASAVLASGAPARIVIPAVISAAILVVQVAAVRPRLSRRSDRILAGQDAPRSRAHYAYVALEAVKVAALLATGSMLLTA